VLLRPDLLRGMDATGDEIETRCIATRYDKTARNFLRAVHLAGAVVWLN